MDCFSKQVFSCSKSTCRRLAYNTIFVTHYYDNNFIIKILIQKIPDTKSWFSCKITGSLAKKFPKVL